ncbi:MAG TPA: RidA family protein [Acidimicrobiia bacterium]
MTSPHTLLNPSELAPPRGFSHVVIPTVGRLVFLAGQAAQLSDGTVGGTTMAEQFDIAARNVVTALAGAGALPQHLVSLQIFVTDVYAYRTALKEIGPSYRRRFGNHYPAIALFEIKGLFDPAAMIELVGIAVVPD